MRFSLAHKVKIAALFDQGWSSRRIAPRYNWSRTQVQKYVHDYKSARRFENRNLRAGRKKITSQATKRFIVRVIQDFAENRRKSTNDFSAKLAVVGITVQSHTVHLRMFDAGFDPVLAKKKPQLAKG